MKADNHIPISILSNHQHKNRRPTTEISFFVSI